MASVKRSRHFLLVAIVVCSAHTGFGQTLFPRILNGTPTDAYESVGIVGDTVYGEFGSGTLISPFHVLTAGHVAEIFENRPTTGTFRIAGETYAVHRVVVHPSYNSRQLINDIALLELADPVLDITPSALFTGTPRVGDTLFLVGYGAGGDANGGDGSFGTKRVATTSIDAVTDTQIIWNFDVATEGNTAPGDSGGPGFIDDAGSLKIASVTSGGTTTNAELGDIAFNTRVDVYTDWINTVLDLGVGDNPPTDNPPTDNPPTDEPPTDEPPTDEPPTDNPPTDNPPVGGGPAHRPPVAGACHRPSHHPVASHHRPASHDRPASHRPQPARPIVGGQHAGRQPLQQILTSIISSVFSPHPTRVPTASRWLANFLPFHSTVNMLWPLQ